MPFPRLLIAKTKLNNTFYFIRQFRDGIRFLDKVDTDAIVEACARNDFAVPTGNKYRHIGPNRFHALESMLSVHYGHGHVEQYCRDVSSSLLEDRYPLQAIFSNQHRISEAFQHRLCNSSDRDFVVHDQNGACTLRIAG